MIKSLIFVVCVTACLTFAGPTTAPAHTYTLGEGKFEYKFSSNWNFSPKNNKDDAAIFVREGKQGQSQINLLPKDADLTDNVAVGILKKIREERKKSGAKVIKEAKIERDKRFNIRIYEEFEYNGHVFAQLHLYRQVKGRAFMQYVRTLDADDELKKIILTEGEDCLASVKAK